MKYVTYKILFVYTIESFKGVHAFKFNLRRIRVGCYCNRSGLKDLTVWPYDLFFFNSTYEHILHKFAHKQKTCLCFAQLRHKQMKNSNTHSALQGKMYLYC